MPLQLFSKQNELKIFLLRFNSDFLVCDYPREEIPPFFNAKQRNVDACLLQTK